MTAADRRRRGAICLFLSALMLTGCGQQAHPAASRPPAPAPAAADPDTTTALLRVAQAFNDAYDSGDFGAVYDRWDARSQAIISRAEYIRRHRVCAPATHSTAVVTGASRGPGGAWLVRYQISGTRLTDTWFYVRHRWLFDIVRSNPGAARLYRLPFARYAAATGCSAH